MNDFETLLYEAKDGVAWLTLNRPEKLNSFNYKMQLELQECWRSLRGRDEVRVVVLTGAGERAFCTGIDRDEAMGDYPKPREERTVGAAGDTPFMFDDPGQRICPKFNDLWKPIIAAVNGIACGGAFYMLGEVDIIIASEDATFFDPHVTYGMTSSFESMHMLQKMPLGELLRMQLMGNFERLSAKRAYEIGLVSEVVPRDKLREAAEWVASIIASAPPLAVQGTIRATWAAQEMPRSQALALGYGYVAMGTNQDSIQEGQQAFKSGQRPKWRLR